MEVERLEKWLFSTSGALKETGKWINKKIVRFENFRNYKAQKSGFKAVILELNDTVRHWGECTVYETRQYCFTTAEK